MTRIAIVDVGTNTTRLFIAEVDDGRVNKEIVRTGRVTRLGAGVDRTGRLAADAIAREREALTELHGIIAAHAVDRVVAVMTSAVRDAENGRAFADAAALDYGLDVHVLTGNEEARLTYRGATDDVPAAAAPAATTLVVDIGGGSTEIVIGHGRSPEFSVSTQAGVVRQADRHITADPPPAAELAAISGDVRGVLEAAVPAPLRSGVERALAVAGTPTSLAAIAQSLDPYDPRRVHGYRLTAAQTQAILERLRSMPLAEREQIPGLHPARAPAILPGIVILTEVMRLFALDAVEVSEHDILRGAAVAFAEDRPT